MFETNNPITNNTETTNNQTQTDKGLKMFETNNPITNNTETTNNQTQTDKGLKMFETETTNNQTQTEVINEINIEAIKDLLEHNLDSYARKALEEEIKQVIEKAQGYNNSLSENKELYPVSEDGYVPLCDDDGLIPTGYLSSRGIEVGSCDFIHVDEVVKTLSDSYNATNLRLVSYRLLGKSIEGKLNSTSLRIILDKYNGITQPQPKPQPQQQQQQQQRQPKPKPQPQQDVWERALQQQSQQLDEPTVGTTYSGVTDNVTPSNVLSDNRIATPKGNHLSEKQAKLFGMLPNELKPRLMRTVDDNLAMTASADPARLAELRQKAQGRLDKFESMLNQLSKQQLQTINKYIVHLFKKANVPMEALTLMTKNIEDIDTSKLGAIALKIYNSKFYDLRDRDIDFILGEFIKKVDPATFVGASTYLDGNVNVYLYLCTALKSEFPKKKIRL